MNNHKEDYYVVGKNAKEISFRDFFGVIKKRFWIIALVVIIATAIGYYLSNQNNSPIYETSTRIIIDSDKGQMSTLLVMVKDPIIMEKVVTELNLDRSPEQVAGQVETEQIDESQVVRISVTDADPKLAAKIANLTATTFKKEAKSLLKFEDVQLLSEAKESFYPINESTNQKTIILFVFGWIIGLGLVFLIDSLDETINKAREVEEVLDVPVIGVISNMNRKKFLKKNTKRKVRKVRSESLGTNKQEA